MIFISCVNQRCVCENHIAQIPASTAVSGVVVNDNDNDPEEVDISNHRYISAANPSLRSIPPPRHSSSSPSPSSSSSSSSPSDHQNRDFIAAQEAELRRLLRGKRPPGGAGFGGGGGPNNNNNMENLLFGPREGGLSVGQGQEEDLNPIKMLQQLMGGEGGGGKLPPGLPPGMAAMLGGMMPPPSSLTSSAAGGGFAQNGQMADDNKNDGEYLWKIIHAVFALGLGIYITAMSTFSGAKSASSGATTITTTAAGVDADGEVRRFFWAFATAELVLQSTRFFLEKGRVSQSGWVGVLMGFLPEPYKGYLALGTRYGGIYTTVVQDAMAVLFVLGCVAWWKGTV